ncbi:MAG: zinc transporter ZupT [Ethanoligenens sp.]
MFELQGFWQAFLLSTGAGLATAVGSLIALFSKRENKRFLSFSLGFAAGVMILVSMADLLPQARAHLVQQMGARGADGFALAFVCIGLVCAFGIERVLPQADNGLVRGTSASDGTAALARVGAVTAVAVTLHNFPEGMATFMAGYADIHIGLPVAVSIALHNIPEGIAVSAPLYYGTGSRWKAFYLSALSGLSEPLGALLAFTVLRPFMSPLLLGVLFAWVAGIMLYLSFAGLIPSAQAGGRTGFAVAGIFAGLIFMQFAMIFL